MVKEETTTVEKKKTQKPAAKKRPAKHVVEINKLKKEKEALTDQLLRKAAEFDNYKKRTERDFLSRIQNSNERLIIDLLPVLDDFERSLEHARGNNEGGSLIEGSELIYRKFLAVLEKEGLKILPSIGEEFDPDKHDALLQTESEEAESGNIVSEHLKGYTLNDKVIRHAQVIVAK